MLFLAPPPFGPAFWAPVTERLRESSLYSTSCSPFQFPRAERSSQIRSLLNYSSADRRTLIAHGHSVPIAWELAATGAVDLLIISNGPISQHWLSKSIAKLPQSLLKTALRPGISLPIFWSSAMFRRLVINPYVMEAVEVRRLCEAQLASAAQRKQLVQYFNELSQWTPSELPKTCKTVAIWGNEDPLFPVPEHSTFNQVYEIEGGAHFHPFERPWAIADIINQLSDNIKQSSDMH